MKPNLLAAARAAYDAWEALPQPPSVQTEGSIDYGRVWIGSHQNDPRLEAAEQRLAALRTQLWRERYEEGIVGSEAYEARARWETARVTYETAMAEYLEEQRQELGITDETVKMRWVSWAA